MVDKICEGKKDAFYKKIIRKIISVTFHSVLKTKDTEFRYKLYAFQEHSYRGVGFSYDKALIYGMSSVYKARITTELYMMASLRERKKDQVDRVNIIVGSFNHTQQVLIYALLE